MGRSRAYLIGAVLLIAIAVSGYLGWNRRNAPKVWFETTEVEFIKCRPGKALPFSVTIRNDGRKPLHLGIVKVTCACSDVRLEKEVLASGESAELTGTITASGATGAFSSTILIASNDPDADLTEMTLRGDVEPYLEYRPGSVSLRPNMHESPKVPLRVRNTDSKPITFSVRLVGIDASAEPDKLTLEPQSAGVIDLSCVAELVQYQEGSIRLVTDHPDQHLVVIPITVAPVNSLEVHPPRIRFGFVSRDEIRIQRFPLVIKGTLAPSSTFTALSIPEFLQVESKKRDSRTGLQEITFAFSDEGVSGVLDGEISFRVLLEDQPIGETTVVVPVGGVVQ